MTALIVAYAIRQLRAPPIPPATLAEIKRDHIVFEEKFTVYDETAATRAARGDGSRW